MTNTTLSTVSDALAAIVEAAAPSVLQVQGRRRPASGVVFSADAVLTTVRAIGRDDGLRVRRHDGETFDAELAGWDPSTGIAVLRAAGLGIEPARQSTAPPRVGHVGVAVARSWSNAVTASAGIIAIIGGPLATGRRHSIEQVLRTTAPMHDGFAGGAFIDASGAVAGITTASAIRGLGVVIPAAIAWNTADAVLHGRLKRGYLGLAGQRVELAEAQRGADGTEHALLVVGVTNGGPAAQAGVLVGDLLLAFDGQPVSSPDQLLGRLLGTAGRSAPITLVRGQSRVELTVTLGERPQ